MKQHLESFRLDLIKFSLSLGYLEKDIVDVFSIPSNQLKEMKKEIASRPVRWIKKPLIKLSPKNKKGFVYFLQTEDEAGLIKIGFTEKKSSIRVSSLKTSCPYNLKLLLSIEGTLGIENYIHTKFNKDRVRKNGEWFYPSLELLAHITNSSIK